MVYESPGMVVGKGYRLWVGWFTYGRHLLQGNSLLSLGNG